MFINLGPKRWLGSSEHKRTFSRRFETEPKTPKQTRSYPASRAGPPDSTNDGKPEQLYSRLFSTPALRPQREEVYSRVYELAVESLVEAENAVEDARSEFYRGGHPFHYEINEAAEAAGGQTDE